MIPITRKELYLNKIVGNNDYETPEKPITTEEFFFAEILGEAVQAPEPLTRYQIYLAKIAGKNIEIPYPKTRLEYFLAKAAGMNIEIPAPITREEIFWSNYSAIVNFEVEGIPPLSFKAKAGALKDYRIYGNTVDGESVGDRTGNLCNNSWEQKMISADTGNATPNTNAVCCDFIPVKPNVTYSCSRTIGNNYNNLRCYGANKDYLGTGADLANKGNPLKQWELFGTFMITDARVSYIRFNDMSNSLNTKYMLVEGAYTAETMPSYEPYGYKVPVTVSNGNDLQTIPIYLTEQIKKVGDEAEYVDYETQKWHRVRKNLLQNTAASQTIDGVTFTVNSDRSVTCNGTANNVVLYEIYSFPRFSGECILSGCPMGGSQNTYRLQYTNLRNLSHKDYGAGVNIYQFDEIQYPTSKINIRIESGYTCNNLTFYPMIRKADIEDDTYEPYITNTELDVTLPALPVLPGTNTLSVGTQVQPSKVYIKGQKERD